MSIPFKAITNGLLSLGAAVAIYFIWLVFKSAKNPDVREAANLRMDIHQFKEYRLLYDELHDAMAKHGAHSNEVDRFFKDVVWPKVKNNPNEWRRYQDY